MVCFKNYASVNLEHNEISEILFMKEHTWKMRYESKFKIRLLKDFKLN